MIPWVGSEPAKCMKNVWKMEYMKKCIYFSKMTSWFLSDSQKSLWSKRGSEPLLNKADLHEWMRHSERVKEMAEFSFTWNAILSCSLGHLLILILKHSCLWGPRTRLPYKGLTVLLYSYEHKREKYIPSKEGRLLWAAEGKNWVDQVISTLKKPIQQNDPIFSSIWVQGSPHFS